MKSIRGTALSARAVVRESLSKALRGWMHELDLTEDDLGRHVGAAQQKVSEWLDPRKPLVPGLSDVRLMPRDLARLAIRWAAEPHHIAVVDMLEDDGKVGDHLGHLARILKESGELTSEYAAAVADGVVTGDERRRVVKEAKELVYLLTSLVHRLEADEKVERTMTRGGVA